MWFGLPASADFDIPVHPLATGIVAKFRERLDANPQIKQAAIRTWETMINLNNQFIRTLQGRLRELPFRAGEDLAVLLDRRPGTQRESATYFNETQLNQAIFTTLFNEVLNNMDEAQKATAVAELIQKDGTAGEYVDPNAAALAGVFQQLYDYMTSKGLPIKQIQNYFPRIWNSVEVTNNSDRIMELLIEQGVSTQQAQHLLDWMATPGEEASFQENLDDGLFDLPYSGFLQHRAAVLDNKLFAPFRSTDLNGIIERYTQAAVKRAEFNQFFGEAAVEGQEWNPTGRFDEILADARTNGATAEQLKFMQDSVDAALGRHGRNTPKKTRAVMAWIATYQNMRLLLFSTLASLPDIVGPAIRSNNFQEAWRTLKTNMGDIVNRESELNNTARVWGIISDTMNQHILNEHFDNHWFPERARQINEKFFQAIGLQRWTSFTRSAALAVGLDFMKQQTELANNGDAKAESNLAELGLTKEDVSAWIDGGEKTFGAGSYQMTDIGGQADHNQKVAQAMIQFVNESIMKPNPAQRPLWASNPSLMLVFHLKSFMYSFHNTVMRQIKANFDGSNTPWQKAYAVAMPGLMLMAFAGLGLELRELLQYKIWGRAGRTDRMDGMEYITEVFDRAGLFGISQLAVDLESANGRGNSKFLALTGPTIQQVNDLINKPFRQTGPKAIPGISQIPELRQQVRDLVD